MLRSILVPLDGSPLSERALPMAMRIAERANAAIHLLHVYTPLNPFVFETVVPFDSDYDALAHQNGEAYLKNVVERLKAAGAGEIQTSVLERKEPISEMIAHHGAEKCAGLVIMTTHGRGGLTRAFLGSVADELIRQSTVPVLLIRPEDAENEVDLKALPEMGNIMVPLDGTPFSEAMLNSAAELARVVGAKLDLVRVIPRVEVLDHVPLGMTLTEQVKEITDLLEQTHQQHRKDAAEYLASLVERLESDGLKVETHVTEHFDATKAILEKSTNLGTDLIALETHARHGLSRWFLGSVADKVIRQASVPVLVDRPHGREVEEK